MMIFGINNNKQDNEKIIGKKRRIYKKLHSLINDKLKMEAKIIKVKCQINKGHFNA